MKSTILKKLNTALPSPVKKLFGPLIRRKLFLNQVFTAQLDELNQLDLEEEEVIKSKQFNKLKQTLIHAYEHTSYYKKLFVECGFNAYDFCDIADMQKIPLLKRADITANFAALQADDVSDYYESATGGSSGASLKILLDKDSIYRERAFIYHFWAKSGYDYQTSKIASFRGGIDFKGKIYRYNPLYNEVQLNPCLINSDTFEKYLLAIDKFKADFIHGLPSAIFSFCKQAKASNEKLKGKYKAVFFISENIYAYQREFIEKTLGCKSYAYYGHTERAVFAEQNANQNANQNADQNADQNGTGYRFNDYYCYVEVDNSNIITTGFVNQKMPLIRYELDDSAYYESGFYSITGHRDGILHGKNGEIISAASLYIHDSAMDKVANQQFVQDKAGAVTMLICPINELNENDRKSIENYYQAKLGTAIDIKVKITHDIHFTSRGKLPLIVHK
ncbi:MAG: hypothetical protein FWG91_05265 [Lachnospiraceae bacterium]|nr:hypothetical protein [Lachnospiraceae bacterium]